MCIFSALAIKTETANSLLTDRYECGGVMRAMLAASPIDAEFSPKEHSSKANDASSGTV
jgi:hypothetical protein